jgi:hypothetical protein
MKERVRWAGHVARGVGENKYMGNAAERTDVSIWTRMGHYIKMGINLLTFWHQSFTFKFWHILYVKCE